MSEIIIRKNGNHYATDFLNWTDGVDAMLKPNNDAPLPHVLVHVANITSTPHGIAPAGMLLINPDLKEVPDFLDLYVQMKNWANILAQKFLKALLLSKRLCLRRI